LRCWSQQATSSRPAPPGFVKFGWFPPDTTRSPCGSQTMPDRPPADTRRACCHVLSSFQRTGLLAPPDRSNLARNDPASRAFSPSMTARGRFLRNLPTLSHPAGRVNHKSLTRNVWRRACNARSVRLPNRAAVAEPLTWEAASAELGSSTRHVPDARVARAPRLASEEVLGPLTAGGKVARLAGEPSNYRDPGAGCQDFPRRKR
jgi:hypothetical protein